MFDSVQRLNEDLSIIYYNQSMHSCNLEHVVDYFVRPVNVSRPPAATSTSATAKTMSFWDWFEGARNDVTKTCIYAPAAVSQLAPVMRSLYIERLVATVRSGRRLPKQRSLQEARRSPLRYFRQTPLLGKCPMPRADKTRPEDCQMDHTPGRRRQVSRWSGWAGRLLRMWLVCIYLSAGERGTSNAVGTALVKHPLRATDTRSPWTMQTVIALVSLNGQTDGKSELTGFSGTYQLTLDDQRRG